MNSYLGGYDSDEYTHQKLYEEEVSTSHFVGDGGESYEN